MLAEQISNGPNGLYSQDHYELITTHYKGFIYVHDKSFNALYLSALSKMLPNTLIPIIYFAMPF